MMKHILYLLIFLGVPCVAEEEILSPRGFIRVANAVTKGTGLLHVSVDGKNVNPRGYRPGDVSGGIARSPGTWSISFSRDGVKRGTTRVTVRKNETVILIAYAEEIPATETSPKDWIIRVLRFKPVPMDGKRNLTFVSVSSQPEIAVEFLQNGKMWQSIWLARLHIGHVLIGQNRGYMPVRSGKRQFSPVAVAPDGNHVVVIYDDELGQLSSMRFRDYPSPDRE